MRLRCSIRFRCAAEFFGDGYDPGAAADLACDLIRVREHAGEAGAVLGVRLHRKRVDERFACVSL